VFKNYIPDFIITKPSGHKVYIEVKGYLRPEDRTKMIAVKYKNPTLDIRFLFDNDNKLNKDSKSRYSDWCNKHNFAFAFKTIPKGWVK
jgi:predicted nuclease of restriction endonuclease-like RecB superfamily